MNKKLITIAIQTAIMGGAISLAPQVYAADDTEIAKPALEATTDEQAKEPEIQEKITVTGSRLRRDSFSVATPLAVLGRDDIEDTGLGSLAEILVEELPQISEGSSNSNSQSSVQNTGLSTIDLRDLGTNRTLTLIDGRRTVSNSYSGNYVSLSTIPSGMVKRVEVITGGASAAYGSDAVAGVVNIITQNNKEGFSVKARGGESTEGGGKEFTLDLDYGTDFADGRGYMFFSSTYDKQYGLSYSDRKRAQQENVYRYSGSEMCNQMLTEEGYQCMRDITSADWRDRSDGIFGGVFGESSRNDTQFWYDGQTLRDDWKDNEEKYGIHTDQFVMLKVPDEAISAAIKVDFELTDDIQSYFQVQYSENRSINSKSPEDEYENAYALTLDPETGEPGRVRPGYIPIDNPYVPEEIANSGLYKDRIYWDRRFAEVGNVTTDNTRTTLRSWAGLQGSLFDDEWDWDISIGYGKSTQEQTRYNELNTFKVAQALDAEYAADGTTIQCADENARADGCVPLNLFGEGSITPEAANYIRSNPTINTDIEQLNLVGYVAGDLFEMPAGNVASVFGIEYRKDSQDVATSTEQQYGGITFNVVPTFSGEVDVWEAFAEVSVPLLRDVTAAKSLSAELSVRVADYSWSGTGLVESYKTGLMWVPAEGYLIRGNYSRAQRAPTITELMSPPRGDYDSFDDICDGVTATSTAPGHDNCRLEPSIAALIAEDPNFEFEDNNNRYSPNTGNADLKEETADTYTFGITIAPSFLEGFNLAVDYYDITVSDAIAQIDNADIINQCYDSSAAWGETNSFCNDITRDNEGNIIEILQRSFNVDELKTRGLDVAAAYTYDLDTYGSLKFKADYTHVYEYSKTFETNDGQKTNEYTGDLDNGIFKDKASASLAWYYDDAWRIRWRTKFKGELISSLADQKDFYEPLNDQGEGGIFPMYEAACANDISACKDNPEAPAFYDISAYVRHDISISYTMDLKQNGEIRFFGGLNNIFDNKGDFIIGGKGNFSSKYGGGIGRFYYAGAEFKF
ncbi:TonB-dependent receptor plug domain-containing protein [Shewanella woodyi]|uniref:TonB-dependent receptor plug domain-containing protein n=1 Tax=Shewanella woodyi TaxID=60961 RepID=UPI00374A684F